MKSRLCLSSRYCLFCAITPPPSATKLSPRHIVASSPSAISSLFRGRRNLGNLAIRSLAAACRQLSSHACYFVSPRFARSLGETCQQRAIPTSAIDRDAAREEGDGADSDSSRGGRQRGRQPSADRGARADAGGRYSHRAAACKGRGGWAGARGCRDHNPRGASARAGRAARAQDDRKPRCRGGRPGPHRRRHGAHGGAGGQRGGNRRQADRQPEPGPGGGQGDQGGGAGQPARRVHAHRGAAGHRCRGRRPEALPHGQG